MLTTADRRVFPPKIARDKQSCSRQ